MVSEKSIYNIFLKISRTQNGLPSRLRKQWEGFEETQSYPHILRLKNFFSRNSQVNVNDFFLAPYTVYPGESGFDLPFYSSPKAIKVYTLAMKKKALLSPDDKHHLTAIVEGLKFIKKFCQDQKIDINSYIEYRNGVQNYFVSHLKNRQVSIYNLFAFKNFEKVLMQHDPDLLRFTLGELYDNIDVSRTKYFNSQKARVLATSGLKKIIQ